MSFTDDAATIMNDFANCTVTAKLSGVAVKAPFPGILDKNVDVSAPFQAERVVFRAILTILASDFAGLNSEHSLLVSDEDGQEKEYTFDGKPRPDGAGFVLIIMAEKK